MKRLAWIALAALAMVWTAPPASQAQMPNDHLKCYKIKDGYKGERFRALADLITNENQLMFPHERSCSIDVNSLEFCLPISKDRHFNADNPREAPHLEVTGQKLENDFLCYNVRCPKRGKNGPTPPEIQEVFDQFGQRDISIRRTSRICTPAWKVMPCETAGAPTCSGECPNPADQCVPSTNIAGGPACECRPGGEQDNTCENAAAPTCNGTCPNPADICVPNSVAGAAGCECQPEGDQTIPCEQSQAPTCGGACPESAPDCTPQSGDFGNEFCQCM